MQRLFLRAMRLQCTGKSFRGKKLFFAVKAGGYSHFCRFFLLSQQKVFVKEYFIAKAFCYFLDFYVNLWVNISTYPPKKQNVDKPVENVENPVK